MKNSDIIKVNEQESQRYNVKKTGVLNILDQADIPELGPQDTRQLDKARMFALKEMGVD